MDSKDFCYWLQGFFEMSNAETLTPSQVQIIKDHLSLVFNKVTPSYVSPYYTTGDPPIDYVKTTCGASNATYCSLVEEDGFDDLAPDVGYNKLYTGHTGITAEGLC